MGQVQPNEPTDTALIHKFVMISAKEQEMITEFARITAEYDELAKKLEASGIPQRRADIIFDLLSSGTAKRTYAEVGRMLGGLSTARIGQIIKAARRRMIRAARYNATPEAPDGA